MSAIPPTSDATQGTPSSIASPSELGEFSIEDGHTKTLLSKRSRFIFSADKKPSNSFYSVTGSYSKDKGTATVNGTVYTWCLKLESATSVKFTIEEEMILTLVFAEGSTPNIKIDGTKVVSASGNIITSVLNAGSHELTKADSNNLFYINLTSSNPTGINEALNDVADEDGVIYDLSGRVVRNPQKGTFYIRNGKKFFF